MPITNDMWEARKPEGSNGFWYVDVKDSNGLGNIATCYTEDAEANSKLIAAAPELLAACIEFVRKVECGEARSIKSYAQMKDAITKAQGKEVTKMATVKKCANADCEFRDDENETCTLDEITVDEFGECEQTNN